MAKPSYPKMWRRKKALKPAEPPVSEDASNETWPPKGSKGKKSVKK